MDQVTGWKTTRLRTSHAFHSRLMEPMLDEFRAVAATLTFNEPTTSAVSTVTGHPVKPGEWTDPEYWVRQVREPVRFADAATALDATAVLELGPDAVLSTLTENAVPAMRRDRGEADTLLTALATIHTRGHFVDWREALGDGPRGRPADLPVPAPALLAATAHPAPAGTRSGSGWPRTGHPLLGAAVEAPDSATVLLTGWLSLRTHPWLADHVVLGRPLVPGTALAEMARAAAASAAASRSWKNSSCSPRCPCPSRVASSCG